MVIVFALKSISRSILFGLTTQTGFMPVQTRYASAWHT